MTNYQDMFIREKSQLMNDNCPDRGIIEATFDEEVEILRGDKLWEPRRDFLVYRYKVSEIFRHVKEKMKEDHYHLFKAKRSWNSVDYLYKAAVVKVLRENHELDFNKVAGYFYEGLSAR